ncbi:uncharacterized protein LOC123317401 [Coccinella septempunctata]|uniref:uncharacterized protein LOC123317401 n=1 Tax=Coccinella septempunctata TaxID=41139 RepID=UPI001D075659|nr:uncharacterized protein LOC123317401 [Coccinella septempunctata]
MPRNQEDALKKGPLLIKIEPCPKTGKAEPCSEECTKECLQKSYTIFDPKPPRKSRRSSEIPPLVVGVVEPPRVSIESTPSSHVEDVRAESSGNLIKSPKSSYSESSNESKRSSGGSHISAPPLLVPVLSEVQEESEIPPRKSETSNVKSETSTEKSEDSNEKSEPSPEKSETSIRKSEPSEESTRKSEISETSTKRSETSTIKSGISSAEIIKSDVSKNESVPDKKEPSIEDKPAKGESQGADCVLEILILEKHNKKCENWKLPGETTDWLKDYNIVSHHAVKICQGQPTQHPITSQLMKPSECICEKSTNVNRFSSCPVCGRCPCHGRRPKPGYESATDSEPLPPSEPLSLSNLSEPDTYVESESSASTRYDYVPDFSKMAIVRPRQEKKYPFFRRCFAKNKRKADARTTKAEMKGRCPQCPEPVCLEGLVNDAK